ncbi:MAG: Rho termination factor N-terminal domain-containing protein, partial [Firmicutes bacterium]|nr:Rho termination factor N-terminal domain-containing protein [Bacillota bacterium]
MDEKTLRAKKVSELREIAAALKLEGVEKMKKAEVLELLLEKARAAQEAEA